MRRIGSVSAMRCSNCCTLIGISTVSARTRGGRRTRAAVDQRHFADDVADTAPRHDVILTVLLGEDLDLTGLDQIGVVALISLGEEPRSGQSIAGSRSNLAFDVSPRDLASRTLNFRQAQLRRDRDSRSVHRIEGTVRIWLAPSNVLGASPVKIYAATSWAGRFRRWCSLWPSRSLRRLSPLAAGIVLVAGMTALRVTVPDPFGRLQAYGFDSLQRAFPRPDADRVAYPDQGSSWSTSTRRASRATANGPGRAPSCRA